MQKVVGSSPIIRFNQAPLGRMAVTDSSARYSVAKAGWARQRAALSTSRIASILGSLAISVRPAVSVTVTSRLWVWLTVLARQSRIARRIAARWRPAAAAGRAAAAEFAEVGMINGDLEAMEPGAIEVDRDLRIAATEVEDGSSELPGARDRLE